METGQKDKILNFFKNLDVPQNFSVNSYYFCQRKKIYIHRFFLNFVQKKQF